MGRNARNWQVLFACGFLIGAIGCHSDSTPSEPSAPVAEPAVVPDGSARLVKCNRQSARVVVKTIGKYGGTLTLNGHQLYIPPGALAEPVTITLRAPVDTIRALQLLPEGLTFNPAALPTLYMNYAGCSQPVAGIVYIDDNLRPLQFLGSTIDQSKSWTSAKLAHFSRYAVHY